MKQIQFYSFLIALFVISSAIAQEAAVVEINAFLSIDSVKQGTGFFFREDSSILTAYHVIEGAKKINVILQNEAGSHSDVRVEFISTKYDIAMIWLPELKKSTEYLRLASPQHIPQFNESLTVIGYPRMGMQQRFRGYTTSNNYIKSSTWRDRSGNNIFNENIDVIPIDLSNYVGMSGAPVISSRGVIGIFSGSYSEGGALGWLIPRKYISSMSELRKRPHEIQRWPPLTLMSAGFEDLRRSINLDPYANRLIQAYLDEVETLSDVYNRLIRSSSELNANANVMRTIIETIPYDQPTIEPLSPLSDKMSKDLGAFEKANKSYGKTSQNIIRKILDVVNWFEHESGLSYEKRLRLSRSLNKIDLRYSKVVNQDYYSTIGYTEAKKRDFVYAGRMMFSANNDAEKLNAVRNFINVIERQMPLYNSVSAIDYASKDVRRHRAYGKIFMDALN